MSETEVTKITAVVKEKNPKRVEQGKRLAPYIKGRLGEEAYYTYKTYYDSRVEAPVHQEEDKHVEIKPAAKKSPALYTLY